MKNRYHGKATHRGANSTAEKNARAPISSCGKDDPTAGFQRIYSVRNARVVRFDTGDLRAVPDDVPYVRVQLELEVLPWQGGLQIRRDRPTAFAFHELEKNEKELKSKTGCQLTSYAL